jgi:signal transduction histidine kinase
MTDERAHVREMPRVDLLAVEHTARLDAEAARVQALEAEGRSRAAAQRQRFLSEASRVLGESIDYEATLRTVARLAVPDIADWCVVDLLQDDGSLGRVAIEHRDPARRQLADQLQRHYPPRVDAPIGPGHVLRTRQTDYQVQVLESFVEAAASEPERLRLLRGLGLNSYICVLLTARDRLLGTITLFTKVGRTLAPDDVAMAEDLARRAAMAIDNARLYEQAQRAVRSRDEMLAIVSHDLRTPLSAIMMGTAVQVATAPATGDGIGVRQRAEVVQRAAQHMCRLINDLTDITHIDAGRLAVERSAHDAEALLREVAESLKPAATERGSRLDYQVVGTLTRVTCDRDRIVQVLSNLVSNAIKVGSPSITLRAEAHSTEIVFAVCDTGPGISQDDVAHIFDRYWRGRTASYKGTGLGLAISKGIIDAHGGRCWVASQVGVGTTFSFALPHMPSADGAAL